MAAIAPDLSKLGRLLHLADIPFKQTAEEFAQRRRLCNTSNLDDVIRDRSDVIRAYLAAVWKRYKTEKVRYRLVSWSLSTLDAFLLFILF